MRITHFLLAFVSAACLTFTGCKKTNEENPAPSTNIHDFFEKYEVKEQSFTINIDDANTTITGEKGTIITFPKSAFTTTEGVPVTGSISIQLKEIYDQSDMVLSNRPTTSDDKLLESGGEVFIAATQNGKSLKLAYRTNVLIKLPAETVSTNMTLFTGKSDNNGIFDWTPLKTVTAERPLTETTWSNDSLSTFYYDESHYIFSAAKIGWINCDRFYSVPNKTHIDLTVTNRGTIENTATFLLYKSINSVGRFAQHSSEGVFRSAEIPIGEVATIIVFSTKNGKQYFGTKEITITENLSVTVDLHEETEETMLNTLQSLN